MLNNDSNHLILLTGFKSGGPLKTARIGNTANVEQQNAAILVNIQEELVMKILDTTTDGRQRDQVERWTLKMLMETVKRSAALHRSYGTRI